MPTPRTELIGVIKKNYPKIKLTHSENWDKDITDGLTTSDGEGSVDGRGMPLFNYIGKEPLYEFGVMKNFVRLIRKHGWMVYFYNNETILLIPKS